MPAFWSALGLVLTLAGAFGIAYAVFRSTTVTKTLELYKTENEAQGRAVARQAVTLLEQEARLAALEKENEVLRKLVIGHEQLDFLVRDSASRTIQHEEQVQLLTDIKEALVDMWRTTAAALAEREKGTGRD